MMAASRESGYYALAGFLYQLVGSGVEVFEITEGPEEDNDTPDRLLLLERFGQDAFVVPCDGNRSYFAYRPWNSGGLGNWREWERLGRPTNCSVG